MVIVGLEHELQFVRSLGTVHSAQSLWQRTQFNGVLPPLESTKPDLHYQFVLAPPFSSALVGFAQVFHYVLSPDTKHVKQSECQAWQSNYGVPLLSSWWSELHYQRPGDPEIRLVFIGLVQVFH